MIIGAHVSTAGGMDKAVERAEELGCTAMQIFGASPRQWDIKMPEKALCVKTVQSIKNSKIDHVYLHASYLVNLASPNKWLRDNSVKNLSAHFEIANMIGAQGLVFHLGSGKELLKKDAIKNLAEGMKAVLKNVKGPAKLLMENSAGGGSKLGTTIEEIGIIFKRVKSSRVGVCIDTAHAFEAGIIEKYTSVEIKKLVKDMDSAFGIDNLEVLHVNDSKTEFESHHDRHENIGKGHIGKQAFVNLAKDPKLKKIPWLLEVPGFTNEGPDKKNVEILKACFKA